MELYTKNEGCCRCLDLVVRIVTQLFSASCMMTVPTLIIAIIILYDLCKKLLVAVLL